MYSCAILWNNLQQEIMRAETISSVKRKIEQNQHDSCRLVMLYTVKNATDLFQVANFTGLLPLVINDRKSHSQTIIDGTEK